MRKTLGPVTTAAMVLCCSLPARAGSGPTTKIPDKKIDATSDPAGKLNGWEIVLKENPMGRMTWLIASNGAKMISPILSMVVNGPSGKVYLFSAETKRYSEYVDQSSMSKVIKSYDAPNVNVKYKWSHWSKCGAENYKGQPAVTFTRTMLNPPVDKARHLTSTYEEKIWIAPFPDSKSMSRFIDPIAKMFVADLPMSGIAVKRVSDWKVYRDGKFQKDDTETELEMLSCKRVAVKPSAFKVPADYQKARSETDVLPDGLSFGLH
jgi:hypothetical protein